VADWYWQPLVYGGSGALLGLTGGIAPGPLTALVIGQTLRFGLKEGLTVSLAPLLTDGPLLLAGALLVSSLTTLDLALGVISCCGAAFLLWLAWDAASASPPVMDSTSNQDPGSVRKSLGTNLLNPHPYLFWFAVGGPLLVDAWTQGASSALAFLVGFFGCLIGSKMTLAVLTHRVGSRLSSTGYTWTMRVLAIAMVGFAGYFAHDALIRFNWL